MEKKDTTFGYLDRIANKLEENNGDSPKTSDSAKGSTFVYLDRIADALEKSIGTNKEPSEQYDSTFGYLNRIATAVENGAGGGGGGTSITVEELNVSTNGTYTAPAGKAYSPVKVLVSNPDNFPEVIPNQTFTIVDGEALPKITVNYNALPYATNARLCAKLEYVDFSVAGYSIVYYTQNTQTISGDAEFSGIPVHVEVERQSDHTWTIDVQTSGQTNPGTYRVRANYIPY